MRLAVGQSASPALHAAHAELLDKLLEVAHKDQAPPCIRAHAKNAHVLSAIDIDTPLLMFPLRGRARVSDAGDWIHADPGEMLLIPRPIKVDAEHIPDPEFGGYTGIGIPLEEHLLSAARQLVREPLDGGDGHIACVSIDDYAQDLADWLNAIERGDLVRACYSIVGVVLRLYAQGHRSLLHPAVPTISARVRRMVAAEPGREWSSAELEAELAMSGATLRRHLAAEGTNLRQLVTDARLSHGLSLLLGTRLPVKSVALRAGYASVSTFVKRFRERYGVAPSQIGGS